MIYSNLLIGIENSVEIATLTLRSRYNIPSWTLSQYCLDTINNSIKLTSILQMCKLLINGKQLNDFAIQKKPKPSYPAIGKNGYYFKKKFYYDNDPDITVMNHISDIVTFWQSFNRLKRSDVLVKLQDCWVPLYDSSYQIAVQLRKITVESPAEIIIQSLKPIVEIWKTLQEKEEIKLKNDFNINKLSLENLKLIMEIAKDLNSPDLPPLIKSYIQNNFLLNCEKLIKLNELAGITIEKIDITV